MKFVNLTYATSETNAAIDTGKYGGTSVADIKNHIEAGNVFQYAQSQAKDYIKDTGTIEW